MHAGLAAGIIPHCGLAKWSHHCAFKISFEMPYTLVKIAFYKCVTTWGFLHSLPNLPILLLRSTFLATPTPEPSHNWAPGPFPCALRTRSPRPAGDPRTPERRLLPIPAAAANAPAPPHRPAAGARHAAARASGKSGAAPWSQAGPTVCSLQPWPESTTAPESPTHPGAAPARPGRRRAPSPALTGVEQLVVAEAPAQGLGYPPRDRGRAPAEGQRSGRLCPALLRPRRSGPSVPEEGASGE